MVFTAKLTTKLDGLSVDDAIVELDNNVNIDELNNVVKKFLKNLDRYDEKQLDGRNFDFLIGGRLLRLDVEEHLKLYSDEIDANEILSEKFVDIEYLLALQPPKPLEALSQEDWVSCVDANDAYIITGSYDKSLRLYNLSSRKLIGTIENAHDQPITKVKFVRHPSGLPTKNQELFILSCGHDEVTVLRKFNVKTIKDEIIFIFRGHSRSVNCVDISDDVVATGSFDRTLRLWSAGSDDQSSDEERENISESARKKSPKGSKKQKTKTSEQSLGKQSRSAIMTLTGHQESITGIKWLGDCNEYKSVASCSMDRSIAIWDIEVGECKRRIYSNKPLLGLDYSRDRHALITASCDRFVRVWDARAPDNASAKAAYTSHSLWVSSVAFSKTSSNHFISGGYDNLVKLWDIRSPKACLYDLIGHHDKVLDVNWNNPDYVLSGSADSTLKIFATKSTI